MSLTPELRARFRARRRGFRSHLVAAHRKVIDLRPGIPRKDLRVGDIVKPKSLVENISYAGMEGPVIKAGPKNVVMKSTYRSRPEGPWHEQEHRIPRSHIEYVSRDGVISKVVE